MMKMTKVGKLLALGSVACPGTEAVRFRAAVAEQDEFLQKEAGYDSDRSTVPSDTDSQGAKGVAKGVSVAPAVKAAALGNAGNAGKGKGKGQWRAQQAAAAAEKELKLAQEADKKAVEQEFMKKWISERQSPSMEFHKTVNFVFIAKSRSYFHSSAVVEDVISRAVDWANRLGQDWRVQLFVDQHTECKFLPEAEKQGAPTNLQIISLPTNGYGEFLLGGVDEESVESKWLRAKGVTAAALNKIESHFHFWEKTNSFIVLKDLVGLLLLWKYGGFVMDIGVTPYASIRQACESNPPQDPREALLSNTQQDVPMDFDYLVAQFEGEKSLCDEVKGMEEESVERALMRGFPDQGPYPPMGIFNGNYLGEIKAGLENTDHSAEALDEVLKYLQGEKKDPELDVWLQYSPQGSLAAQYATVELMSNFTMLVERMGEKSVPAFARVLRKTGISPDQSRLFTVSELIESEGCRGRPVEDCIGKAEFCTNFDNSGSCTVWRPAAVEDFVPGRSNKETAEKVVLPAFNMMFNGIRASPQDVGASEHTRVWYSYNPENCGTIGMFPKVIVPQLSVVKTFMNSWRKESKMEDHKL